MARQMSRIARCALSLLALSWAQGFDDDIENDETMVKRWDESEQALFRYHSRPDIRAPTWNITVPDPAAVSPGYIFFAPYSDLKDPHDRAWTGPYIYDQTGELVWSGVPIFHMWNTFDFRPTKVDGRDMLSLLFPHEQTGVILDSSYERHITQPLNPDAPILGEMHEFNVLPGGTALNFYRDKGPVSHAKSLAIGFDGECKAGMSGFMETDLETHEIVFQWRARDHIGLEESTYIIGTYEEMCNDGWDSLHLNSISKFPDGDYLLSSRHTSTLYKIDRHSGEIIWRLGGVKNDFQKDFVFSRQHHSRAIDQNSTHITITVFDNAIGTGKNETASNDMAHGLVMSLRTDTQPMTAEVLQAYAHPEGRKTSSRGSVELLPNGNAFICWTYGSLLSEHTPDGNIAMRARTNGRFATYRAFKYPWVGRPANPPDARSVAVSKHAGARTTAYVSWNGATEVASWNLLRATPDGSQTDLLINQPRSGFETTLVYSAFASFVVLEALDAAGQVLGRSAVVTTERSPNFDAGMLEFDAQWLREHGAPDHAELSASTDGAYIPEPDLADNSALSAGVASPPHPSARPSSTANPGYSSYAKTSGFSSSSLMAQATPLLLSPFACYIYGVLSVILVGLLVQFMRSRARQVAWWKGEAPSYDYHEVWQDGTSERASGDEEAKVGEHS